MCPAASIDYSNMSWTQIEKLAKAYQKAPGKATAEALDKCLAAFQGPIETFARLFIKPLVGMQDMIPRVPRRLIPDAFSVTITARWRVAYYAEPVSRGNCIIARS